MINTSFPMVLYKYRDWSNELHLGILESQEVYFASPHDFNDPFDCSLPFQYSEEYLTSEQINLISQKMINEDDDKSLQNYNPDQVREHQDLLINDPSYRYYWSKQITKESVSKIGMVCLTENPMDILMWSHYGNSHKGFCIGFDSFLLTKNTQSDILRIDYPNDEKFITWKPFESIDDNELFMRKLIGTKSKHWSYEQEFRLFIINIEKRCIPIPKQAFKEIIFGVNMDKKLKVEKIEWLINNFPEIRIYEAELDKGYFRINMNLIYEKNFKKL